MGRKWRKEKAEIGCLIRSIEVFKACSVSIEQKPVENQITFIILKIFRAKFSI